MGLKIFHTADVHLGLTFGDYPEAISQRLSDARFETLEAMVERANREGCQLFVVAGDLFETTRVGKRLVTRAAKILSGFEGQVLVLPGNHDYITHQPDEIWSTFQEAKGDRVRVLGEKRTYSLRALGIDACVYAAPCHTKKSESHGVGWITPESRDREAKYHVGIAHGSFESLTPDLEGNYFPMTRQDLLRCNLDLWLMGHIHLQFPVAAKLSAGDRVFYSGTPEPDGFDCRHEGKAWLIELGEDREIRATSLSTGRHRFHRHAIELSSADELESAIAARLAESGGGAGDEASSLLRLRLSGALERGAVAEVAARIKGIEARFLHVTADLSGISARITPAEIKREFADGSFAHRLLEALAAEPADGEAAEALQLAYAWVKEAGGARE